jgi:hypothetical protein
MSTLTRWIALSMGSLLLVDLAPYALLFREGRSWPLNQQRRMK